MKEKFTDASSVFYLFNDGLKSSGIIESEVGKDFAVNLNTCFVDKTHELRVGEVFKACSCIDTLDPESTEITLLILAVAVGVGKTLFPGILGYGPHIAAATEVTTGKFEYFLAASS